MITLSTVYSQLFFPLVTGFSMSFLVFGLREWVSDERFKSERDGWIQWVRQQHRVAPLEKTYIIELDESFMGPRILFCSRQRACIYAFQPGLL